MSNETIIYVGKTKPLMNYVYACMNASKTSKVVKICGRGQLIPDAVTIAEIFKRKINATSKYAETVVIGSTEMENKFKRTVFVSFIEIIIQFP
jgi:DNA-binding protein Alba